MKYFLSIAAICKNEAPYIAEWIEFHLIQGVEHFYIYDNESTDNTLEILEKYSDVVTVTNWPGIKMQIPAYNDVIKRFKEESEWIAFLDCDEFLYSKRRSLPWWIDQIDRRSYKIGVIAARWLMFGSNGKISALRPVVSIKEDGIYINAYDYPRGLVIEEYTKRAAKPDKHVKSIVKMSKVFSTGKNPHVFYTTGDVVDEWLNVLPTEYAILENKTADTFCINHYHTKSYEEYLERRKKPDPSTNRYRTEEQIEESFKAHDCNEVEDLYASQFAEKIKENIKCRTILKN